jgi:hypothetical protein
LIGEIDSCASISAPTTLQLQSQHQEVSQQEEIEIDEETLEERTSKKQKIQGIEWDELQEEKKALAGRLNAPKVKSLSLTDDESTSV